MTPYYFFKQIHRHDRPCLCIKSFCDFYQISKVQQAKLGFFVVEFTHSCEHYKSGEKCGRDTIWVVSGSKFIKAFRVQFSWIFLCFSFNFQRMKLCTVTPIIKKIWDTVNIWWIPDFETKEINTAEVLLLNKFYF